MKKKAVCFGNVKQYVEYAVATETFPIYIGDVQLYGGHQVENNDMDRACDAGRGEGSCIQSSMGGPEGNRPLGSPKRRWEADIKINLKIT